MKRLRRFFRYLSRLIFTYVLISAVLFGFIAFGPSIWSPPFVGWIEKSVLDKAKTKIKISHLYFSKVWPLTLRLAKVDVLSSPLPISGTIGSVDFAVSSERVDGNWLRPRVGLTLALVDPKLKLAMVPEEPIVAKPGFVDTSKAEVILPNLSKIERPKFSDLDLAFAIYRGELNVDGHARFKGVKNLNFYFRVPSLRAAEWNPYLKADAVLLSELAGVGVSLPLEAELARASVQSEALKFEDLRVSVAKLNFKGKGYYAWEGNYDLQLDLKEADVARLPPSFLPPGNWQGVFNGAVRMQKQLDMPRKLSVAVESQNLKGNITYKGLQTEVAGEVTAQARLKLELSPALNMDDSTFLFDLSKAKVTYGTYFLKLPGTDMSVLVNADARENAFNLRRAQIRVAHVRLDVTGDAKLGEKGKIQAQLFPTSISGLEKLIPPLVNSPIQGVVSGQVEGQGQLDDLKGWAVELKKFNIAGLRGRVNWSSGAITVQGPITGQVEGRIQTKGLEFEAANWDIVSDLSDLTIHSENLNKPAGYMLKLATAGRILGNQYVVEKLRLVGDVGDIQGRASWTYEKSAIPLSANLNLSPLRVGALLRLTPLPDLNATGDLSGQVALNGKWIQEEGIQTSPLQLAAQLVLKDGDINYQPKAVAAATPPAGKGTFETGSKVIPPLLPNWPLLRTAKITVDSGIRSFVFSDLKVGGITHVGQWIGGQWKGTASVENLFNGTAQLSKLILSPLASPPSFEMIATFQGVHADPLMTWIKPKLKGYLEGRIAGEINGLGAIPTKEIGLSQVKADGKLTISQGLFKTVNLDEMINKELKKLGVGSGGVKNSPLPFAANADFIFQDSQLNLEKFKMVTSKQDELGLRGLIDTNLQAQLTGTIALSSSRLGGSVAKANADSQGRLVVPMQLKGNLLRPEFSISDATIASMLTKTVEFEAKKVIEDFKKDPKKAQEDLKKKLKKAFGR